MVSMSFVDPNQFIISRKRKKYRFALFANSPICFELGEWQKRPVDVVEIGAGTGIFSVELAKKSPEKVFLALDVKADRLQKGARLAEELGLDNIFFVRARADQLNDLVEDESLSDIWVTFADPFPKRRSAGRRLTHPNFLARYRQALKPDSRLLVKHDNHEFFCWSLEQLVQDRWQVDELAFDLHDSELSDDYKIKTTYEQRWTDEGRVIGMVVAKKLSKSKKGA